MKLGRVVAVVVFQLLVLLGGVLLYDGIDRYRFTRSASAEDLDICLNNRAMDCNTRGWRGMVTVGGALLLTGFAGLFALARSSRSHRFQ